MFGTLTALLVLSSAATIVRVWSIEEVVVSCRRSQPAKQFCFCRRPGSMRLPSLGLRMPRHRQNKNEYAYDNPN